MAIGGVRGNNIRSSNQSVTGDIRVNNNRNINNDNNKFSQIINQINSVAGDRGLDFKVWAETQLEQIRQKISTPNLPINEGYEFINQLGRLVNSNSVAEPDNNTNWLKLYAVILVKFLNFAIDYNNDNLPNNLRDFVNGSLESCPEWNAVSMERTISGAAVSFIVGGLFHNPLREILFYPVAAIDLRVRTLGNLARNLEHGIEFGQNPITGVLDVALAKEHNYKLKNTPLKSTDLTKLSHDDLFNKLKYQAEFNG